MMGGQGGQVGLGGYSGRIELCGHGLYGGLSGLCGQSGLGGQS